MWWPLTKGGVQKKDGKGPSRRVGEAGGGGVAVHSAQCTIAHAQGVQLCNRLQSVAMAQANRQHLMLWNKFQIRNDAA